MNSSPDPDITISPQCGPVSVVSYSAWTGMKSCEWKAAYSRDPRTRGLSRGSVFSAIGNARHGVEEDVARGMKAGWGRPTRSWVEQRFTYLLGREAEDLQREWAPTLVPAVRTWPHVTRVRMTLGRRLGEAGEPGMDLAWPPPDQERAKPGPIPDTAHWQAPSIEPGEALPEVWLLDLARQFRGQIDRLERTEAGFAVTDFKSGIDAGPQELVQRHRQQLIFYSGLVDAAYGNWPTLAVHSVSGQKVNVDYGLDEAKQLRDDVDSTRASFNRRLKDGSLSAGLAVHEPPCPWCPFRVVCPVVRSQWEELVNAVPAGSRRALSLASGKVTSVSAHDSGKQVVIVQEEALTAPSGPVTITRLSPDLDVEEGSHLSVSGLDVLGPNVLRVEWNSIVRVVKGAG